MLIIDYEVLFYTLEEMINETCKIIIKKTIIINIIIMIIAIIQMIIGIIIMVLTIIIKGIIIMIIETIRGIKLIEIIETIKIHRHVILVLLRLLLMNMNLM